MKLKELLHGVEILEVHADLEMEIASVAYDSRKVTQGVLFAAVSGFQTDGNRFISMALDRGAAAILTAKRPEREIPYILAASDRLALAQVSANFYAHPAKKMTMIGVTGTNGKTSVALLLKQVLEQTLHAKVGLVGTMGNQIGDLALPTERTTPESLELQALFAQMRDAGCTHVVMEVSSHAIALERVGGVHYQVAAFTNLTEEHLDFHHTMENYCDTKARLFSRCDRAVLNRDDGYYERIRERTSCPVLTISRHPGAELRAEDVCLASDGVAFMAVLGEERVPVRVAIPGKFTVYNALTVLGIAVELGISLEDAAKALAAAKGVRGRVEVVPTPGKPYTVLIDYAHTPDGLENVLASVRSYCKGRVIVVFGCGGDRDPMKRPIMGRIGVENSDLAIITSDNPRSENPLDIIRDIVRGIPEGKNTYITMENRPQAIRYALDIGEKNDIIVLAGKGHETYQEVCGVKRHMDEREIVAEHLAEMEKHNG
ncbi:MAG TPA: UDP-N-acetylmuramoyl-L-alanyl-D-glutamate--2,6-diaminopimelate ligase [Candidatus Faecousia intestinigallinarum]|nr:UDP-N-acetylmuramoyl-L-alanyl-D-glutamate--2,6-diaminopimelate ligase [Candidatus Faecousia intestinigallinarum]